MSQHIKIFIKNKCNEITENNLDGINKFLPFYVNIIDDDLAYLFAYMHYKFNNLFDFLNYKFLNNRHFNAHESRELLTLIELYWKLNNALKKYSI